jgi:hypothetical protein
MDASPTAAAPLEPDLLLVEDLLLLLLDDDSGTAFGEGTLYYVLGGAVLAELALRGAVEPEGGRTLVNGIRVAAVDGEVPADPLLREAYEKVARKPRGVNELLIEIGSDLRGRVLDRLVERGFLRREKKRVLGLFATTRLPAARPDHEKGMLELTRSVLVDGVEPDARTAALVALVSASGTLPQFHKSIGWSGGVYTRGKQFENANWAAQAVGLAVTRTAGASAAGTIAF